ncbi:MAG TPA: hypothetical protein VJP05_10010 [Acidimicrobiia bacterium]|nr:hypothetical protein [Acidimicrobiia bacterium]
MSGFLSGMGGIGRGLLLVAAACVLGAVFVGGEARTTFAIVVGPRTAVDVAVGGDNDQEVAIDWDSVGGS